MIRGIYAAAAGMAGEIERQNAISNNMANINSPGFKRDMPVFTALREAAITRFDSGMAGGVSLPIGGLRQGPYLASAAADWTAGDFVNTGAPLDLAIEGDGFFAVLAPGGEMLTRNGSFKLDPEGQLVTQQGYPVLGESGLITIHGSKVTFTEEGDVLVDGNRVDRLKLVIPVSRSDLEKIGDNLFRVRSGGVWTPVSGGGAQVRQGYLEASNVDPIVEMVSMIAGLRAYEANQKIIHMEDEALDKAVNEVGRVG